MRTTSIIHCKNSNYAIDFQGSPNCCMSNFVNQCKNYESIWAILLNEDTGEAIMTYTGERVKLK